LRRPHHKSRDNLSNTYAAPETVQGALCLLGTGILFRILFIYCVCCRPLERE
jgi:hypothetical protein